jgi:plastocyanin
MSNSKPEPHEHAGGVRLSMQSPPLKGHSLCLKGPSRATLGVIAIFAIAAISGCGSGSSSHGSPSIPGKEPTAAPKPAGDTTIRLQNIAIHPAKLTIKAGSTVTWQWLDGKIDTAHNVTSLPDGLQFKPSGTRLTGVYAIRFQKPGKYFYECTIHPASMQGEIVVE